MPRSTLQTRTTLLLPSTVLARIKAISAGENTALAEMIRRAIDDAILSGVYDMATKPPNDEPTERFILYMPEYMEQMLAWTAQQQGLTMHELAANACDYFCRRKEDMYEKINAVNQAATEAA